MKTLICMSLAVACLAFAGCGTPAPTSQQFAVADYGPPIGEKDREIIKEWARAGLKDPDSAKFEFEEPRKAAVQENRVWTYVWVQKFWINAKNSYGGYTGREPYWVYYRDGRIYRKVSSWEVPKGSWGKADPDTLF
jgi:hypothetical protein